MYPYILAIHNIVRWIALILGIIVVIQAGLGFFRHKEWNEPVRKLSLYYTIGLDIQILLGLLLYLFFSSITRAAFQDLSSAMSNPGMRFFALEHAFYMILAVVFGHLGSVLARKSTDSQTKYRRTLIWVSLSVLMILLGMPWDRPFLPQI